MKINTREDLSVGDIQGELLERRPLPIGRKEFMEWSDRIIKASLVVATEESQRFSLAGMLMHLGPTEAFKEDGYFVLALRKYAVAQTGLCMINEIKTNQEERNKAADTAPTQMAAVDGLLENKKL